MLVQRLLSLHAAARAEAGDLLASLETPAPASEAAITDAVRRVVDLEEAIAQTPATILPSAIAKLAMGAGIGGENDAHLDCDPAWCLALSALRDLGAMVIGRPVVVTQAAA